MRCRCLAWSSAQIGADGQDFFSDPRPELLTEVTGLQPKRGREWVDLSPLGFRSTQRLRISDYADGVLVATWPAELKPNPEPEQQTRTSRKTVSGRKPAPRSSTENQKAN